jgi:DNA recombination protein RmuC
MTSATLLAALSVGAISAAVAWLLAGNRAALVHQQRLAVLHEQHGVELSRAAATEAVLRAELVGARASLRTEEQAAESFRSIATAALREQSEHLTELATARHQQVEEAARARWDQHGTVLARRLEEYARHLGDLERQRQQDGAALRQAVDALQQANLQVRDEARNLHAALRNDRTRGVWGEVQLRRVLEQAGMQRHADFLEQRAVTDGERTGRPDVVVHLPDGHRLAIDAKVPLTAFLDAAEAADDTEHVRLIGEHGKAVGAHLRALADRRYTEQVDGSVDFVVLFVPGDAFLSAAFEGRPELFDESVRHRVLLASPSTLVALLWGVASGWRERDLSEQAGEIAELGRELHRRMSVLSNHLHAVGTGLHRTVKAFNDTVGSYETRVGPQLRRFDELGAGSGQEPRTPARIETPPRSLLSAPDSPANSSPPPADVPLTEVGSGHPLVSRVARPDRRPGPPDG